MKAKELPPVELLRAMFDYDPETGIVTRKVAVLGHKVGEQVGSGKRYFKVQIRTRTYLLHRVIWKLYTGEEPQIVDHINGDIHDNRINNLRSTTPAINNFNRSLIQHNSSGYRGVSLTKANKSPWQVSLGSKYVGRYETLEEAIAARLRAETERGIHISR